MYKMLVLDMDGTLLNNQHQISKENFQAIQEAANRGVKIILASGRAASGIYPYLEELNLITHNDYYIAYSGAIIQNNTGTRIMGGSILNLEDLRYVYNIADELNMVLNIYTYDGIVAFSQDYYSRVEAILNNVPLKVADINMLDKNLPIAKITLINNTLNGLKKLKEFFSDIHLSDVDLRKMSTKEEIDVENHGCEEAFNIPSRLLDKYTVVKTSPFSAEIINKDCNKWEGVKRIAEELNVSVKEIICIGDSENDIHMIENAGLGVAMDNAFPNVKEVSDFITHTNEENGVAHVINEFILNEKCLHTG